MGKVVFMEEKNRYQWRISLDGENDFNDFLSKVEMYVPTLKVPLMMS